MNKLSAPAATENEENELINKALLLYLDQNKSIHTNFLSVLFEWITFLDISENQQRDILNSEEVRAINPEWYGSSAVVELTLAFCFRSDFLSKESLF